MKTTIEHEPVKNGKWKEFNKHAILVAEGVYVNGEKHGIWKEYYDHTGELMIEEEYNHGVSHGIYRCFHPNGKIWSEGRFENGRREGYFRVYDEKGNHLRTLQFVNDKQVEDTYVSCL